MSLLNNLSALALTPLLNPQSRGEPNQARNRIARIDGLALRLTEDALDALRHANDLAWQTLEYLLGAPHLLKNRDRMEGVEWVALDQFASVVSHLSQGPQMAELLAQREETLSELRQARQAGLVPGTEGSAAKVLEGLRQFTACTSAATLLRAEEVLAEHIARTLAGANYPGLARWFERPPQPGCLPLVVQALRLHLQREHAWGRLFGDLGVSLVDPAGAEGLTAGLVSLIDLQWQHGTVLSRELNAEPSLLSPPGLSALNEIPKKEMEQVQRIVSLLSAEESALRQIRPAHSWARGRTPPRPAKAPISVAIPAAAPQEKGTAPGSASATSAPPDLRRRASIRWYRRMNPERMYPLLVVLSRGRVKEVKVEDVAQAVSAEQLVVSASHPFVVVRPVLPGLDCYPPQQTVDITPDLVTVRFRVTARMLGQVEDARIELYARDRLLSAVPLDIKVVRQTIALIVSVAGVLWPLLGTAAKKLGLEVEDSQDLLVRVLQTFLGLPHAIEMGFGILLLAALGFYWWNRPLQAGADTDVLGVQPLSLTELLIAGRLAAAKKEWAEAVSYLEDAVNVDPSSAAARTELAAARVHLPGTSLPSPVPVELPPRDGQAEVSYRGYRTALDQGKWAEALEHLQEAVRLAPERFEPFPFRSFVAEKILGAGGFGVSFLCRDQEGQQVVVKAFLEGAAMPSWSDLSREAHALERLNHPNIPRLQSWGFAGEKQERPYLVTDYFAGQSLREVVLTLGPFKPTAYRELARLLAETLQAAHLCDVLHCDVNPSNILLRRLHGKWEMRLIDFGIAQSGGQDCFTKWASKPFAQFGTHDYAAPEQIGELHRTPGPFGPYSDVFGFGRTSYFALLGTPLPDDDEKETLPPGWRALLRECTARQPERRLKDFEAVLKRLKA